MVALSQDDVFQWFRDSTAASRADFLHNLLDVSLPFEVILVKNYAESLLRRRYPGWTDCPRTLSACASNDPDAVADSWDEGMGVTSDTSRQVTLMILGAVGELKPTTAMRVFERVYDLEALGTILAGPFNPVLLDTLMLIYTLASKHPSMTYAQKALLTDVLRRLERIDSTAKRLLQNPGTPLCSPMAPTAATPTVPIVSVPGAPLSEPKPEVTNPRGLSPSASAPPSLITVNSAASLTVDEDAADFIRENGPIPPEAGGSVVAPLTHSGTWGADPVHPGDVKETPVLPFCLSFQQLLDFPTPYPSAVRTLPPSHGEFVTYCKGPFFSTLSALVPATHHQGGPASGAPQPAVIHPLQGNAQMPPPVTSTYSSTGSSASSVSSCESDCGNGNKNCSVADQSSLSPTGTDSLVGSLATTSSTTTRGFYCEPTPGMEPATVVVDQACFIDGVATSTTGSGTGVAAPALAAPMSAPSSQYGHAIHVRGKDQGAAPQRTKYEADAPVRKRSDGRGFDRPSQIQGKEYSGIECDVRSSSDCPSCCTNGPIPVVETKMYQVSAMSTVPNPKATMSIEPVTAITFMSEPNADTGVAPEKLCLDTVPPNIQLPMSNCCELSTKSQFRGGKWKGTPVIPVSSTLAAARQKISPDRKNVEIVGGKNAIKVTATVGSSIQGRVNLSRVESSSTATAVDPKRTASGKPIENGPLKPNSSSGSGSGSVSSSTSKAASPPAPAPAPAPAPMLWSNGTTDTDWPALAPIMPSSGSFSGGVLRPKRSEKDKSKNRTKNGANNERPNSQEDKSKDADSASSSNGSAMKNGPVEPGDSSAPSNPPPPNNLPPGVPPAIQIPPAPLPPPHNNPHSIIGVYPAGPFLEPNSSAPSTSCVQVTATSMTGLPFVMAPGGAGHIMTAPHHHLGQNGISGVYPYNFLPNFMNGATGAGPGGPTGFLPQPGFYIPSILSTATPPSGGFHLPLSRIPLNLNVIASVEKLPPPPLSQPYPPPSSSRMYCYNCGRKGHLGADCKEDTLEDEFIYAPKQKIGG